MRTDKARQVNETTCRALRVAQRFVLSPLTVETARQLAEPAAIERTRGHLFAPARIAWFEWDGNTPGGYQRSHRHGLLLVGEGEGRAQIVAGWGGYVINVDLYGTRLPLMLPFDYDLAADNRPILRWIGTDLNNARRVLRRGGRSVDGIADISAPLLGAFLGAALALINTPRLSYTIEHDNAAVNKRRSKLGRPPFLSWHEVRIALDRGELGLGQQLTQTGERALHHVRTFLRIKRGRVELVRPHWRGNPRFGVVRHRYVAFRAEDEPGSWSGGPLPVPKIIDE